MQYLFLAGTYSSFRVSHVGEQSTCAKRERFGQSRSYSREEVSDCHGGAGLVASLHSAVFAESDIESLVNGRLVGVIVIWQQSLLERALVFKGGLQKKETESDQKPGRPKRFQTSYIQILPAFRSLRLNNQYTVIYRHSLLELYTQYQFKV